MLRRIRKCLDLLMPRERWRWARLIPLAIVAAGLEAVGAAVVFALIRLVSDTGHATTTPAVSVLARWGGGRPTVLSASVVVGLFYIFKNIVLTSIAAAQSRVSSDSVAAVSRRMLRGYLAAPFTYHLRRNSAELIHNSTYAVQMAFGQVMDPTIAAITDAGIAAAIILVLMVKAPLVTALAVGVLCTLLGTLLTVTRRALACWGRDEQALRGKVLQTLRQTFDGLKEIKLRGHEAFYYEGFSRQQRALVHLQYLNATLTTGSRLLIETVFIWGVLLVIVLVTLRGHTGDGAQRAALERLAADIGLTAAVRFTGWVEPEDVPALINAHAAVLMPSRYEPFGLVALQAAQMGRPLIGSRIPGLSEVVRDGDTGVLCRMDDAADLAAAIASLLEHPAAAARMGQRARAHVQEAFRWDDHVDAYEALFHRVANLLCGTQRSL